LTERGNVREHGHSHVIKAINTIHNTTNMFDALVRSPRGQSAPLLRHKMHDTRYI